MYNNNKYKRVSSLGTVGAMFALLVSVWAVADLQNSVSVAALATAKAAVPYINPPSRNSGEKRLPVTPNPLYVELDWTDGAPHDVDLWIRCYSEAEGLKANMLSVGYRRTSDGWMDLQRDDLGQPSYLNREVAQANSEISRVPANTVCQFNAHLFHSHGGVLPVEGRMLVIQDKDSEIEKTVADVKFLLKEPGQEITVASAQWNGGGILIKDSVKTYPAAPLQPIATAPLPANTPTGGM